MDSNSTIIRIYTNGKLKLPRALHFFTDSKTPQITMGIAMQISNNDCTIGTIKSTSIKASNGITPYRMMMRRPYTNKKIDFIN